MAQFDLAVVRTLAECPGGIKDGKATLLKFSTDVSVESRFVPGEAYSLDPRMTGLLKTSSLEVQYFPNGTLKSIGMAAEDRSGQVVENVAKVAAAGLMMASGVPPVAVASAAAAVPLTSAQTSLLKGNLSTQVRVDPVGPQQIVCTDAAKLALTALAQADEQIKESGRELAAANAAMTALVEEVLLELRDPADRKVRDERAALLKAQRDADAAIEHAKQAKAKALEGLSVKQTLRWPEHFGDASQPRDLPLDAESRAALTKLLTIGIPERAVAVPLETESSILNALRRLANNKALSLPAVVLPADPARLAELSARLTGEPNPVPAVTPASCLGTNVNACVDHHLNLLISVALEWPLAEDCAPGALAATQCVRVRKPEVPPREQRAGERERRGTVQNARNAAFDEGVFIREPAQGRILVCRKALSSGGACPKGADLAEAEPLNFPQLGQLRFLPFKVPMFQGKDMGVFLTADGRLERYYMKSTKAALEAATASAANAATTMADALERRETELRSDAEYVQSERGKALAAQIAELENAEKLRKQQTPPAADPLKPVRESAAENQVYITQLETQLIREQLQLAIDNDDNAAAQALLAILRSN
jgi:hypothetical protein